MTEQPAPHPATLTAFEGTTRIGTGDRLAVALAAHTAMAQGGGDPILVFDDASGEQVEFDLRGTAGDVAARLVPVQAPEPRGPGRPKLGVVAREVTLLPRHWDWLSRQPGGASVALRRLVETARFASETGEAGARARDAAYRFATAIAGNQPDFDEAMRALFARDVKAFEVRLARWAPDLGRHALAMAQPWFADEGKTQ
ncbi:DUF2239 family protein [Phreatobacter aquaticus]|uniref:DUF2239 family protein n=2 Tax=Phreatobacter aquaticus TaxID=2570229 RepID=A0A4D7QSF9_9HYPH|nr:DUF2239 family protein [Phreatobacter aquaticus]